ADAFHVTGPHGPVGLNVALAQDATGTRTVATLTFTGSGIVNGSLADGRYTLTIDGDSIVDASGAAVDGDGDGTAGGDAEAAFFRLFGDSDGDGDVDRTDLRAFAGTLGRRSDEAGYLPFFDYDGNGFVGVIDTLQFARRLGRRV